MLTKVPISKLAKYSIVASGYTGRLVCFFKFVEYDIVDGKLVRTEDTHKCDEYCPEIEYNENIEALFIFDRIWGEGFYASPDLDLEKYGDDIAKILNNVDEYGTGIIVYFNTGDVEEVVNRGLDYCACYGPTGIYALYDGDRLFALYYEMDCESG